jgi:hypothetical protein
MKMQSGKPVWTAILAAALLFSWSAPASARKSRSHRLHYSQKPFKRPHVLRPRFRQLEHGMSNYTSGPGSTPGVGVSTPAQSLQRNIDGLRSGGTGIDPNPGGSGTTLNGPAPSSPRQF